jgi:hypothetical protein
MKINKNVSPYQEMYLVPPNMYEKLLTCLHEKEKKQVEELNVNKDVEKPGDKQIQMLSKEALNIIPETEQKTPPVEEMVSETNQPETVEPEQEVMIGEPELSVEPELSSEPKITETETPVVKGRLAFEKPTQGKVFTCQVCFKSFRRSYDLTRHLKFVHKNLELDIPAMLKISQSEAGEEEPFEIRPPTTMKPSSEEDIEMLRQVPTQPCKINSQTTTRVIPELYFQPPKKKQIIVPQIKQRLMLVPQIAKIGNQGRISKPKSKELVISEKKKSLIVPQFSKKIKKQPLLIETNPEESDDENPETKSFEDWDEGNKGKKTVGLKTKGKRTSSEAKLPMKQAKVLKVGTKKKPGTRTSSEAQLKMKPAKKEKTESFDKW